MFDATVRFGDLLVMTGFLVGGWKMGTAFRDDIRDLKNTVYGSDKPPVEGLVRTVKRLERVHFRRHDDAV
jgi:hypothetical protein